MTNRGRIACEYLFRRCISLSFNLYLSSSCIHAHALSLSLSVSHYLSLSDSLFPSLPPLSVYRARKFELRQFTLYEISNFEANRVTKYIRNNYLPYCLRCQCVWYSYMVSPPTFNTMNRVFLVQRRLWLYESRDLRGKRAPSLYVWLCAWAFHTWLLR